jgi:flavodoxin I
VKAVVIFDSVSGNTANIAEAVSRAVGSGTRLIKASEARIEDIAGIDLLILGSPTYGGRPTDTMSGFLRKIGAGSLGGISAAAFDTRLSIKFVKLFGFAANRIAAALKKNGAKVLSAEGFIVKGGKGPLAEGEIGKATEWAKSLAK